MLRHPTATYRGEWISATNTAFGSVVKPLFTEKTPQSSYKVTTHVTNHMRPRPSDILGSNFLKAS